MHRTSSINTRLRYNRRDYSNLNLKQQARTHVKKDLGARIDRPNRETDPLALVLVARSRTMVMSTLFFIVMCESYCIAVLSCNLDLGLAEGPRVHGPLH